MTRRTVRLRRIVAALAACVAIEAAPAYGASDFDTCSGYDTADLKRPDTIPQGTAACTREIASGRHSAAQLAYLYRARGFWKHKARDLQGSLADYDQAIRIEPNHVQGYDYRADVYQELGQWDLAIADYNRAIRIDPTYAAAYYSRGLVYEQLGQLDQARASYRAALAQPARDDVSRWAHDEARARLQSLDRR